MTNAAVATLRLEPALAGLAAPHPGALRWPFHSGPDKRAATIGMGMTEKQGGTDVRANTTQAAPIAAGGPGAEYILVGHKWFLSAPMSDAFLVLAQAPAGLTCFLPLLPDGAVNALGCSGSRTSWATVRMPPPSRGSPGAHGWAIGEEGRGCGDHRDRRRGSTAPSRPGLLVALAHAIHHAEHRTVFQRRLIEQPLMMHVLADLALEVEGATALAFRLRAASTRRARSARGGMAAADDARRQVLGVPVAPPVLAEAMECLGGNGYVEELPLARLYREVPVNAIWKARAT